MTDYGNKRQFTKAYQSISTIWLSAKQVFKSTIPIFNKEVPFWTAILMIPGAISLFDLATTVFGSKESPWVPVRVHLFLYLVIAYGFIEKKSLKHLWAKAGYDPKQLRTKEAESQNPDTNRLVRLFAIVFLASGLSTFVLWYRYLSPFNTEQLGIDLNLAPLASFLDLWLKVFAINSLSVFWGNTFLITVAALLGLHVLPVARWLVRKTMTIHIVAVVIWVLMAMSMWIWWENVYNITF